jgi:hypothetical protein
LNPAARDSNGVDVPPLAKVGLRIALTLNADFYERLCEELFADDGSNIAVTQFS